MQIHNAIITGSFSYNGADLSNVTSSNAYSASLSSRTTDLESTSSVLVGASSSFSSILSSVSSSQQQISSSFLTLTASFNAVSASQQQISASYISLSASYNTFSGSASTRITVDSASLLQVSASQQQISASLLQVSASYIALSGSYNTFSGSASTRVTQIEQVYATTGSNSFRETQSITGSLTVTGQIIAQTINVQQVTSSIIYSSGSNNFGNQLANTQTFTGSMNITGSCHSIFGNVGIGATAPTGQLHICGYDPAFRIQSTVSGNMQMGQWDGTNNRIQASGRDFLITVQDSYNMLFNTNATERMRISGSNGYVGIGTITPLDNLHIAASEVGNVGISIQNTNASYSSQLRFLNCAGTEKAAVTFVQSTTSLNLNVNQIDALVISSTGVASFSSCVAGASIMNITNTSPTGQGITLTAGDDYASYAIKVLDYAGVEKLRLDGNGNLLVGYCTDQGYKFGVNGTSIFSGAAIFSGNALTLSGNNPALTISTGQENLYGYINIVAGTASNVIYTLGNTYNTTGPYVAGALALIGTTSGGISISATCASGCIRFYTCNTERMTITSGGDILMGYGNVGSLLIRQTAVGTVDNNSQSIGNNGINYMNRVSGVGLHHILFNNGNNIVGSITSCTTATQFNTTSDYRLKTDLKNYNGICLINQIKTYDFAWKLNDARTYGVIAHELSDIIPYAVTGEKDALDERGCILPQAVDYSKIVTPLIKAVQEQQCTICSQATMINQLKTCLGIN